MKPRISLLGLLGLTTLAGVACAALAKPSAGWTVIAVSLTVASILVQVVRLIAAEGAQRVAIVGWLTFVVAYLAVALGPWLSTHIGRHLPTSQAIVLARQRWPDKLEQPQVETSISHLGRDVNLNVVADSFMLTDVQASWVAAPSGAAVVEAPNYFRLSAHWLFAWLAGWIGAIIATFCFHRGTAGRESPQVPSWQPVEAP